MIIWNGFGFLVVIIAFAVLLFTEYIAESLTNNENFYQENSWVTLIGLLIAAIITFGLHKLLSLKKPKIVIDKESGEEIKLNDDHSLFFIPVKWWPIILVVFGIIYVFTAKNNHAQIKAIGNTDSNATSIDSQIKKYEKAIQHYETAINNFRSNKYKEAIKNFTKAIELNPKYSAAYNNRGCAKSELGLYQEAIKDFNKAIELDSKSSESYNNRGYAKGELGSHQEAIEDFNKAIKLNPKSPESYNNRACAKQNLGKEKEAIEDYTKAIALEPDSIVLYDNRIELYIKVKRYKEAIEDILSAQKIAKKRNNIEYLQRYEKLLKKLNKGGAQS